MNSEKQAGSVKPTERLIQDALIDLYREKALSRIKIAEITEHCHVSRATFYFYFADIYDCLEKIENELLDGIGASMNAVVVETVRHDADKTVFLQPYRQMLDYIAAHQVYFRALLFGSESTRFRMKYTRNIQDRFRLSLEMDGKTRSDLIPYLCALYAGAIVNLFSYWLASGMGKDSAEIAQIAYQALFCGLMNPAP